MSTIRKPRWLINHLISGTMSTIITCSFILSWKVDGNMLGNNFRNTGSKNSMNGTIIKTAKGTSLKISAVVRVSCCLSLLERLFPPASFNSNLVLILTSAQRSFIPNQQCCNVDLNSSFQWPNFFAQSSLQERGPQCLSDKIQLPKKKISSQMINLLIEATALKPGPIPKSIAHNLFSFYD